MGSGAVGKSALNSPDTDGHNDRRAEIGPYLREVGRAASSWRIVRELRGGEGGIRTHGTVAGTPHFECGAFDLSATSPQKIRMTLAGRSPGWVGGGL